MIINTFQKHDGQLFVNLGMSIASGDWLGDYNELTLIKGVGYPAFLGLGNLTGLPLNMVQALTYFVASWYFSKTISILGNSELLFWTILVGLLLAPPIYDTSGSSILREHFYTATVLVVFAALFRLVFFKQQKIVFTDVFVFGLSLGVLWLTREESVWVIPAMLAAVGIGLLDARNQSLRPNLKKKYFSIALSCLLALTLVCLVGLQNRSSYGRFVINELKEPPFQSAMTALRRAAFPDWRPYVPVPREARFRIYQQSPTFAQLQPFLDPKQGTPPWQFGCEQLPQTCGDLAGDWFAYAVRDGAAKIGAHASANTAAQFYSNIADEVESACDNGRLECTDLLPRLIPPFTRVQLWDLPRHLARVSSLFALTEPLALSSGTSHMDARRREEVLSFLNYPPHVEATPYGQTEFKGWYYSAKDSWFSVIADANSDASLIRQPSPDIAAHFKDEQANQQRFTLAVDCFNGPCGVTFEDEHGVRLSIAIDDAVGSLKELKLGNGLLYFDVVSAPSRGFASPRAALQKQWLRLIKFIQPAYQILLITGGVAFMLSIVWALRCRVLPLLLKVSIILAIAVVSRATLLTLIDAFSFPVYYGYALPAIPLLIALAIISIYSVIIRWRGRREISLIVRYSSDPPSSRWKAAGGDLNNNVGAAPR